MTPGFFRLLPVLVPFALLFAGGLGLAVAQSFGLFLPFPYSGGMLDAYRELLKPYILSCFVHSLYIAFVSSAVSVSVGTVLACGIWRLPLGQQKWTIVYKIPLILPHIAIAFIILVLWSRSGLFSSVAFHLGLTASQSDFPAVLYGGAGGGMIMAYVLKEVPFVILLAYAALKRLDQRYVQTARMLGASRWRVFWSVVIPHLRPSLNTAFIILFLYTFGAFDIPFLLGESEPEMLAVKVYNLYFRRDLINRPTAMAMLVVMFLISTIFIVIYSRLAHRLAAQERKL